MSSRCVVAVAMLGLAACASAPLNPPLPVSPTAQRVSYCGVTAAIDPIALKDEEQTAASRRWLHVWEGGQWLQDEGRFVNGRWVSDTRSNRPVGPTCTALVIEDVRPDRPVVSTLFTGKGRPILSSLVIGGHGDVALYLNSSRSLNGTLHPQADTIVATYHNSRYWLIGQDDGTVRLLAVQATGTLSVVLRRAPLPAG